MAWWYAGIRGTGSQMEEYRRQARDLTADLPDGAAVLEIAPGPGYLAIEMARLGRLRVTTVDLSRSFVRMVQERAREAGVRVEVCHGDAAQMPLPDDAFDRIVCQAAFKNFGRPAAALNEMHRVLRPGGMAVITDMNRDTTSADIAAEVRGMHLGGPGAFLTRCNLDVLRRRAYSRAEFEGLAAASPFGGCGVETGGIGMTVRLRKRPTA